MTIEINIDCDKTEKALAGLSALLGKRVSEIIKNDFLHLNEDLSEIATAIKSDPNIPQHIKKSQPYLDLIGILS